MHHRKRSLRGLEALIAQNRWVIGGQNFDQDLHFSSLYTRLSAVKYQPKRYEAAYHTIIAVYEDFNEVYYLVRDECERVALHLLDQAKTQPDWLENVVADIYEQCKELTNVFTGYDLSSDFSRLSNSQVAELYERHNRVHWKLYEVARVPEVLDRGLATFTGYLKTYLRQLCSVDGTPEPSKSNKLFCELTMPSKPSIFQEESFNFIELIERISSRHELTDAFKKVDRHTFLRIDADILQAIEMHRRAWGFRYYHGYGFRNLPGVDHYLEMIGDYLKSGTALTSRREYERKTREANEERERLFDSYHIDSEHRRLFTLYAEIGLAKLYRRFVQLRNFYYLDRIISQIALRSRQSEGMIRCLLPEEVMSLLSGDSLIDQKLRKRMDFLVHVIDGEKEMVYGGKEYKWIKEELEARARSRKGRSSVLSGTVASPGSAEGECKVILRLEDAIKKGFKEGDILVSEATDPDLIDIILKAGGVVTQQGGVTSHAAIICRELDKPTLIGVEGLLATICDGDIVKLDAYDGSLVILRKAGGKYKLIVLMDAIDEHLLHRIGHKAENLWRLANLGVDVPFFIVIPTDTLLEEPEGSRGFMSDELAQELENAYQEFTTAKVVIRSSALVEDNASNSMAGRFPTLLDVEGRNIVTELNRYVTMLRNSGSMFGGAIIVQEMIEGQISGVCFTLDPISGDRKVVLIEAVRGLNYRLTGGISTPDIRLRITLPDQDIMEDVRTPGADKLLSGSEIREMLGLFTRIEAYFACPQDIEWTISNGRIYVLQSRPITTLWSL